MLAQLDIAKYFDIYCDASDTGLGCVLMQEVRVISYSLWQLRCHEEHYPTYDLELMIVVLSTWECGSHLYEPTSFEYAIAKMAQVDQRL
jgi:hypothetical protein